MKTGPKQRAIVEQARPDQVSVAVGGACDHPHEVCPQCGESMLHRTDEVGSVGCACPCGMCRFWHGPVSPPKVEKAQQGEGE
jgi:hypothetical protein